MCQQIYILWFQGQNENFQLETTKSYRYPKIKIHGFVLWQTKEVIWSSTIAMHISAQEIDSLIIDIEDFYHSWVLRWLIFYDRHKSTVYQKNFN